MNGLNYFGSFFLAIVAVFMLFCTLIVVDNSFLSAGFAGATLLGTLGSILVALNGVAQAAKSAEKKNEG
jgi:hypothetical protein